MGVKVQATMEDINTTCALIIEDEAYVRDVVKNILQHFQFSVIEAENGDHALDLIRENPNDFDVIFLDLTMPGTSGAEVLRHLRAIRSGIPVIVMSGHDEGEATELVAPMHFEGFIQKPFEISAMMATIRRVVESD